MIRTDGYVRVQFTDGGGLNLAMREYDQVLTAWKEREAFYEGTDPYGGAVTFSLEGLRSVARIPADALAGAREEEKLDKLEGVE